MLEGLSGFGTRRPAPSKVAGMLSGLRDQENAVVPLPMIRQTPAVPNFPPVHDPYLDEFYDGPLAANDTSVLGVARDTPAPQAKPQYVDTSSSARLFPDTGPLPNDAPRYQYPDLELRPYQRKYPRR
jgi:hypothetical protein